MEEQRLLQRYIKKERILAEVWNKKLFKNEAKDFSFLPVYTN